MEKEKVEIIFRIAEKFTQVNETEKAYVAGYTTRDIQEAQKKKEKQGNKKPA